MKSKLSTLILITLLLLAGQGWAATYYVSPSGSNTSPYDTWAKAANQISTVITAGNTDTGGDGPHVVYVAPDSGSGYGAIGAITDTDWIDGTIIGTIAHGSTTQSTTLGQVKVIPASGSHGFATAVNVTMKGLTFKNSDSTHDLMRISTGVTSFVGENLFLCDSGRYSLYVTGAGIDIKRFKILGSSTSQNAPVVFDSAGAGRLSYGELTNSLTNYLCSNSGILANTSGTVNLDNIYIAGQKKYGVVQAGAGTTNVTNSIVSAGWLASTSPYALRREAGTLNYSNNIIIDQWPTLGGKYQVSGGTDGGGNLLYSNPQFTHHQRKGIIIPRIDDLTNADDVATLTSTFDAHGYTGTFAIWSDSTEYSSTLTGSNLTKIQSILSHGTWEIACHSRSHCQLSLTGNTFSITKPTGSTLGTIAVSRAGNTITLTDDGGVHTVSGFKTKTLTAIKAEIDAFTNGANHWATGALTSHLDGSCLGEALSETVTSSNIQLLIDATGATGYFKDQIVDGKISIETAIGTPIHTLVTPWGQSSSNVQSCAFAGSYESLLSSSDQADAEYNLSNIDVFRLGYYGQAVVGATENETRRNIRALCEWAAQYGGIVVITGHDLATTITQADWEIILDTLDEYSNDIIVGSAHNAITYIKANGWSTADSGRTYTHTWTDESNCNLQSASPAIGTGSNTPWTGTASVTDYAGSRVTDDDGDVWTRTISGAAKTSVDIGAYNTVSDPLTISWGTGGLKASGGYRTDDQDYHWDVTPDAYTISGTTSGTLSVTKKAKNPTVTLTDGVGTAVRKTLTIGSGGGGFILRR